MQTHTVWKGIAAGALGGLVASWVMNQYQSALSSVSEAAGRKERERKGKTDPPPQEPSSGDDATVKTAKAISSKLFQHALTDDQKQWAGPLVHCAFGTSLGALYGGFGPQHSD